MGAENAILYYEAAQTARGWQQLTDSGDHLKFTAQHKPWSRAGSADYKVRLIGLATGGAVTGNGVNDQVSVAALTAYMPHVSGADSDGLIAVAANSALALGARPTASNKMVSSITVNGSGALAVVAGTEGASVSATRAVAGGPPLIPDGSIEIAQVTRSGSTAAPVVTATDVSQVPGTSQERYDYPVQAAVDSLLGTVTFTPALDLIHTGTIARRVYASYSTPVFAPVAKSADFVPPATSYSVSSTAIYGGAIGSSSASLGQGSFTAYLADGVTDPLLNKAGQNLLFKFFPDRNKAPYTLAQGILGITQSFPASGAVSAACTISAEAEAERYAA